MIGDWSEWLLIIVVLGSEGACYWGRVCVCVCVCVRVGVGGRPARAVRPSRWMYCALSDGIPTCKECGLQCYLRTCSEVMRALAVKRFASGDMVRMGGVVVGCKGKPPE